jgi:UDP-glucose 4-epimerase
MAAVARNSFSKLPLVLVTGGAGFIGSHLVERLLAGGKRVAVIDDLSTGRLANLRAVRRHPGLEVHVAKISTCRQLNALAARAEAIYHLAAAVGVELVVHQPIHTIHTNLRETEALLEAASRTRTPVLLASTSEVYGKSRKRVFAETDDLLIGPPHLGRWAYACSKLMDEFLALAYAAERGLPVVIARLFNTVGPRQTGRYGMVLPRFIAAAQAGQPIEVYGDGAQTRCFCFVGDTVEALLRLHNTPAARGQVVNVGGTGETSILDLARLVKKICRSRSPIRRTPYAQIYPQGFEDMQRRKPKVKRLRQLTGYRPQTPLPEIIRRTMLLG